MKKKTKRYKKKKVFRKQKWFPRKDILQLLKKKIKRKINKKR